MMDLALGVVRGPQPFGTPLVSTSQRTSTAANNRKGSHLTAPPSAAPRETIPLTHHDAFGDDVRNDPAFATIRPGIAARNDLSRATSRLRRFAILDSGKPLVKRHGSALWKVFARRANAFHIPTAPTRSRDFVSCQVSQDPPKRGGGVGRGEFAPRPYRG
jgi:hypothetical protein